MTLSRRVLLERSAAVAGGVALAPLVARLPAPAAAAVSLETGDVVASPVDWANADYWALADRILERFDGRWQDDLGGYLPVRNPYSTVNNAALLTVHATAALHGHQGPARNDERARELVRRLTDHPAPFRGVGSPRRDDKMFHTPGWISSLSNPAALQDKAIDPKVAEGLALAHRAADAIGLEQGARDTIVDYVDRCARGRFFRYPSVRLNQINWNCELYAMAAQLTGDPELLRRDYRSHVEGFCRYATRAQRRDGTPNLGPGWHFTYLPQYSSAHPVNLDSAEYANETIHFILFHAQARRAGAARLSGHAQRVLEAWVGRVLCGYWTHAGYLNWDSGLGLARMHKGKTWGLAHQGLLAIALAPEFHRFEAFAGWAKHFYDAGLATFGRLLDAESGDDFPDASLFDLAQRGQDGSARNLWAARMAAHAVRAVDWELTSVKADRPPPLYAFDPDSGRLAISTPVYSTVILPRNRRTVDYGGLEPARLLDGRSRVVASLGGNTPASFGLRVRTAAGGELVDTQSGQTDGRGDPRPRLEVMRYRRGRRELVTQRARPYPRHPYASSFDTISARGVLERSGVRVETLHRFREERITLQWRVRARTSRARRWEAAFPSDGGDEARLEVGLRDGAVDVLNRSSRLDLADVDWFAVRSADSGYIVVPRMRGDLEAWVVQPGARATAPHPGPTLMLGQRRSRRLTSMRFRVEIALLAPEQDPASLTAALFGG